MPYDLGKQSPVFVLREGHRYLVNEIRYDIAKEGEKVISITANFNLVDTKDAKPHHMTHPIPSALFDALDEFNKRRHEMPGMAFVIEMKKNADGSGDLSWDVMGLNDPTDRRYT